MAEKQLAQTSSVDGRDERPTTDETPRKRLSPHATITAAALARKGHTPAAIAKLLGGRVSPSDVKLALTDARTILEAFAPRVAADWLQASSTAAAKGDHRPAKELLQHLDVVTPVVDHTDPSRTGGVHVQIIGFGFAGLPTGQGQVMQGAPSPAFATSQDTRALDVTLTPSPHPQEGGGEGQQE